MTLDPGLAGWLQLALTPGLGPSTLRTLLREFGLPQAVLTRKRSELARYVPAAALEALDSKSVQEAVARALDWAAQPERFVVTLADDTYPRLLLEIPDPPPLLYAHGRVELLGRPGLAVVGSRNATAQGERNAEEFAKALSGAGLTVISGLALGIDAAAHRGGLAQGCLVVEAALASGSLITARAAAEQGREVFALPGSIHSPLSKGCHALIKSGAKLAESAEDVLSELAAFRRTGFASTRGAPAAADVAKDEPLLACMGFDPVDVDSLCARAGMPAERVSAELLRLELAGRISALPGGLYQRLN